MVFFKEKYGKISDCWTPSYSKTVSGENFLSVTVGSLRTLCTWPAKRTTLEFLFLFAALHGQQPRPLFRAQAPLHGQETSTDPWSYLTRMANFN